MGEANYFSQGWLAAIGYQLLRQLFWFWAGGDDRVCVAGTLTPLWGWSFSDLLPKARAVGYILGLLRSYVSPSLHFSRRFGAATQTRSPHVVLSAVARHADTMRP